MKNVNRILCQWILGFTMLFAYIYVGLKIMFFASSLVTSGISSTIATFVTCLIMIVIGVYWNFLHTLISEKLERPREGKWKITR